MREIDEIPVAKAIMLAIVCLSFASCCHKKITTHSQTIDSVRVVREVEYIERLRDTVIFIPVPVEIKEVIRLDSSYLETSFAESDAKILPDGSLYHTLYNKPQDIKIPIQVKDTEEKIIEAETIIQYERIEVPIKMPLSNFQWFLIISGLIMWFALIIWIIFKLIRR